jgi:hypothetical protein
MYNGYRFHPKQEFGLFNPDLILYTLNRIQELKSLHSQFSIKEILDNIPKNSNNSPSQSTLTLLSGPLSKHNSSLLKFFGKSPIVMEDGVLPSFQLAELNNMKDQDERPIFSLIFYLGGLTYASNSPFPNTQLVIPNLLEETSFLNHLTKVIALKDDFSSICQQWIDSGDISEFCQCLTTQVFSEFQNRDVIGGEDIVSRCKYIKIFFFFKNKFNFQTRYLCKFKIGIW